MNVMRVISLALAAALLAACATTKVTNPVTGQTERTVMDEAGRGGRGQEGARAGAGRIRRARRPAPAGLCQRRGPAAREAVAPRNLAWTFTVLDSPDVNAFALPGGYVYVTRGILAYLDSEADLAGVVGHEIGHVTARHGAQRATKQQRAGVGVVAATVLGVLLEAGGVRGAAQAANDVSSSVAAGSIASYSREQELQADQLGAEYLSRTGLNPKNMVDVIGVLKDQERFAADSAKAEGRAAPQGANWLASHPSNDQRLQTITRIAERLQAAQFGDERRTRYLQAIDGITFGDSREQGVVRGAKFYHEPLGMALTAPPGWSLHNDAEELLLVNRPATRRS